MEGLVFDVVVDRSVTSPVCFIVYTYVSCLSFINKIASCNFNSEDIVRDILHY